MEKETGMRGLMRNMPSAMQSYGIQRHRWSCPGSMLAWGNPPNTETFISLHILHLMKPAACNGTYRSCVGGALALAFIHFLHLMCACEIVMLQRELFISFQVLPLGKHGCVALLLHNSEYTLRSGEICLG